MRFKQIPKLLIVEDNVTLAFGLSISLKADGYDVQVAGSLAEARSLLGAALPDLVLLDLMLPDGNGLDLLRQLRSMPRWVPVIILSARVDEVDRISGFQLGADDYVTKPFSTVELQAIIRARLKQHNPGEPLLIGSALVDFQQMLVTRGDRRYRLTRQEARLLSVFLSDPGEPIPRGILLTRAWGYPPHTHTRTLDYCVNQLRDKLEEDAHHPQHIITVRGVGYQLDIQLQR